MHRKLRLYGHICHMKDYIYKEQTNNVGNNGWLKEIQRKELCDDSGDCVEKVCKNYNNNK